MKTTWKYRLLSGFCVLVIAGTSTAGVLAADQSWSRRVILQENSLQETAEAAADAPAQSEETVPEGEAAQENKAAEAGASSEASASAEAAAQTTGERPAEGEHTAGENAETETTALAEASDAEGTETTASAEAADAGGTETQETSSKAGPQKIPREAAKTKTRRQPLPATEEEIDAYFDGMVLIGDSVMVGFRNYSMRRANTFLGRIQFLASGSFSVHNSLWPINSKSVHPIFQGQQRFVWDSLSMIQPKRVFLFFGLNDMNMGSLADTCAKYSQLIANIKTTCPDTEIHLMSMTYTLRGKGKGNLNNPTIRQFNEMLKQMARDNGWGFVDIANPLSDANGDLAPAYCSDNYVHQTNAAYDVWAVVLRDYARSQLEHTSEFSVGEEGNYAVIDGEGVGEVLKIDGETRRREEVNETETDETRRREEAGETETTPEETGKEDTNKA